MQVVAHAVLAPSGHNMQPWTVQLDEADPARHLTELRPGRESGISLASIGMELLRRRR